MTPRGALTQGTLATLGLLVAYGTWQREPERAAGDVTVIDVSKSDVDKVRFEENGRWAEVHRGDLGGEKVVLVKTSGKPKQEKAAPGSPAAKDEPQRELKGSESAEHLLENFGPLRAARSLGVLDAAKLKEVGLDASKKKITVSARGEQRAFLVASLGFGSAYFKDERDGRVYIVNGSMLSDLESAGARLTDRALHDLKPTEFDALTLTVGAKKKEFGQANAPTAMAARITPKGNPGKTNELAQNWHDRVWRLIPIEMLGQGEQPTGGAPQVALRLEYSARGRSRGFLELARGAAPPPPATPASSTTPPPPAKPADVFARTEHTVGWVKLPMSADELIKEADKVVTSE
jgi:hypothetical protein